MITSSITNKTKTDNNCHTWGAKIVVCHAFHKGSHLSLQENINLCSETIDQCLNEVTRQYLSITFSFIRTFKYKIVTEFFDHPELSMSGPVR